MGTDARATARRLGTLVEPLAAAVYFAPQAQKRYEGLGLNYFEGYFCSRSAPLGAAPWRVVAAVFAAFKPAVVEPAVTGGWAKADPATVLAARLEGAREQMADLLGEPDEAMVRAADLMLAATEGLDGSGRPLYSGLVGLEVPGPDDPFGRLWRAADRVREHRGDGHIAAWVPHLDAAEATVLSEPWWGIEPGSYAWTRGWGPDDIEAARGRLVARGLLAADGSLTEDGRRLREDIELATDAAALPVVERLGDDAGELFGLLEGWSEKMRGPGGYPVDRANLFSS